MQDVMALLWYQWGGGTQVNSYPGRSLVSKGSCSRAAVPLQLLSSLQGQRVSAVGVVLCRRQPAGRLQGLHVICSHSSVSRRITVPQANMASFEMSAYSKAQDLLLISAVLMH